MKSPTLDKALQLLKNPPTQDGDLLHEMIDELYEQATPEEKALFPMVYEGLAVAGYERI